MDWNKQAEFERTIETYADSFLKADNPRLIYEMAYTEVSMRHGRPKLAPKEVKLNEETAARTLYRLIADADDPEKLDINNAMKEVYRTLGDSSLPYQQELQAAIHEKLPVIESKLEAAVEQQEIQRRMRSESKVTPEELYEHIGAEPEIVSDALFGKKGKGLVVYAFSQAAEKINNDNITDFMLVHNKHFEIAYNDLLEECKADRAAKGKFVSDNNVPKADHDRLSHNAEKVAMVTAALELSGSPADKAIAQRMLETPRTFIYVESRTIKLDRIKAEYKIKDLLKDKAIEIIGGIKDRITNDPNVDILAANAFMRTDRWEYSQVLGKYSLHTTDAKYVKYFEKDFYDQIIQTPKGRSAFVDALDDLFGSLYDRDTQKEDAYIILDELTQKKIEAELTDVIDERYGIDSSENLSNEAFEKVYKACYNIIYEHLYKGDMLKTAAEEAVEEEHKAIENDIGKDMTD